MAPEPGTEIMRQAAALAEKSPQAIAQEVDATVFATAGMDGGFISLFTIFVLAIFVGYYVIWNVTPALHSPLMSVTNAISSVIIVGALIAAGPIELSTAKIFGFIAVTLASINIFGGFIVTQRMLKMYKKKAR
ncbi:MAG: NAD(P) transhydrogenase subunit alpha [Alphaproteobacteria bacterium]